MNDCWSDIVELQDVAGRILLFSEKGPRGICILSANGAVSNVTIRQPGSTGGILTYEVWSQILMHFLTTLFGILAVVLFGIVYKSICVIDLVVLYVTNKQTSILRLSNANSDVF